jgi:hypothetical protein
MKKLMTVCLACACILLAAAASRGSIVQTINVNFDEKGNGYYFFNGGTNTSLIGEMFPGPPGTLVYYDFPWDSGDMIAGDVKITESVGTNEVISDVLRFTTINQDNVSYAAVFVFSDLPERGEQGDMADTGIPESFLSNVISRPEEGTENGWNGLHYTPTPNQPGYVNGKIIDYVFTSDEIPEPATICMLGFGALSLIRRKNKKHLGF